MSGTSRPGQRRSATGGSAHLTAIPAIFRLPG